MSIKKGLFIFGLCAVALLLEIIFYWAGLRSTYPPSATQKIMTFLTVGTMVLGGAALIGGLVGHFTKKEKLGENHLCAFAWWLLLWRADFRHLASVARMECNEIRDGFTYGP